MSKLATLKPNACSCPTCQAMCRRPCWGTPRDIQKIIDAGFGDRLTRDGWFGKGHAVNENDIKIICPSLKGHESKQMPFLPQSEEGCTFFKEGLCELHHLGLKPSEGALVTCNSDDDTGIHKEVAMTWNSDEGRAISKKWSEERGLSPEVFHDPFEIFIGGLKMCVDKASRGSPEDLLGLIKIMGDLADNWGKK